MREARDSLQTILALDCFPAVVAARHRSLLTLAYSELKPPPVAELDAQGSHVEHVLRPR
jgi:hypothetical protein